MVVSKLALGPKLTQRKGGRAPLPLPGRKESGEIVLHCELETSGCPWQKAHQIDHSWAGPLIPPPTAPPPPTTEALAKSLSACHGSVFQLKDFTLLSQLLVTALLDEIRGQH